MRSALVNALIACSDSSLKTKSRRFLQGLSSDELQFIAEYVGACILESGAPRQGFRSTAATPDQDHKMILLREYLRVGRTPWSAGWSAAGPLAGLSGTV